MGAARLPEPLGSCPWPVAVPASSGEFLFSSLKVTLGLLLLSFAQCDFAVFLKSRGAARILPLSPGFLDFARDVLIHRGRTLIYRLLRNRAGHTAALAGFHPIDFPPCSLKITLCPLL